MANCRGPADFPFSSPHMMTRTTPQSPILAAFAAHLAPIRFAAVLFGLVDCNG